MIKHRDESKTYIMNVELKNGITFEKRDFPNDHLGGFSRTLTFWVTDTILRTYPLEEIRHYEIEEAK